VSTRISRKTEVARAPNPRGKQPAAGGNLGPNNLVLHSLLSASDCNNTPLSLPRHSHSAGGLGFGTMPVLGTQPGRQVHHPHSSSQSLSHRGRRRNASRRQLSGLPWGPLTVSGTQRSTPTRYGLATPEPNDGIPRRWFPTEFTQPVVFCRDHNDRARPRA
jgi:hypothetical protein